MATEMSRSEIDALLEDVGVGVLSLTDGAETYAIPESYGYDGKSLYFQFVYDADSTKMAFIDTTDVATVTVFRTQPSESVLVRGRLERVPEADSEQAAEAIAATADIPTVEMLPDTTADEASMTFYRLIPEEFSGRVFDKFTREIA